MECLRPRSWCQGGRKKKIVLILVVMECLRPNSWKNHLWHLNSFNPCCNGMFETQRRLFIEARFYKSFNPCCNGMFETRILSGRAV